MATKKTTTELPEEDLKLQTSTTTVCLIGTTPFIGNRMAEKGLHDILFPPPKKNASERASSLKHNPVQEYRSSPYVLRNPKSPSYIAHLPSAFKGAIKNVALDMPGSTKAQIGRLVSVDGEYVPMFGGPKMLMSVVRSADMNHTPDVRTRCILPEWCCEISVTIAKPLLSERKVLGLLAAAGVIQGTGDWRPGKGNGTFGRFRLCNPDDPEFLRIKAEGGREAQRAALLAERPECYDDQTEELFSWFLEELVRRDRVPTAAEMAAEAEELDVIGSGEMVEFEE